MTRGAISGGGLCNDHYQLNQKNARVACSASSPVRSTTKGRSTRLSRAFASSSSRTKAGSYFGTINYNQDTGKVIKCDLCEGEPECATACPTDAITYIDANWTGLERMRAWAQRTDAGASAGK